MMRPPHAMLLLVVAASGLKLPPGIEDEIFCPDAYCRSRKDTPSGSSRGTPIPDPPYQEMPAGFAGPKRSFWECLREADHADDRVPSRLRPITWGRFSDLLTDALPSPQEARAMLVKSGHHSRLCAQESKTEAAEPESSSEAEEAQANSGDEATGDTAPLPSRPDATEDGGPPMWQVIAAIAVIGATAMKFRSAQASRAADAWAAQSQGGREEARKRQLERFEREAKERAATPEWRATQKEAEREAKGAVIMPEHRKNTMSQSTTQH